MQAEAFIGSLLLPIILIILDIFVLNKPPKKINDWYGFRTSRAMKNLETWNYANQLWGKLSLIGNIIVMIVSLPISIYSLKYGNIKDVAIWMIILQGIFILIPPIIIVQINLKRKFDDNGKLIR